VTQDPERELLAGALVVVLRPPTEQDRVRNSLTEGASESLSESLRAVFGPRRWPSLG
jgi:hypothetical protein